MPKKIRNKSAIGLLNYTKGTGHTQESIKPIINSTIEYTTTVIINSFSNIINNTNENITNVNVSSSSINNSIIKQINVTSSSINTNIQTFNNSYKELTIPNISDPEIENLYNQFVFPYLTVGPYRLPSYSEFERVRIIIDKELEGLTSDRDYKLRLYKGLLDILFSGRSMYFYDLQLESENTMLRNKLCELEKLVKKYSSELALCNGANGAFYMVGNVGIRLNKPKNLIYAQALLNINLAWYIYLYNTKKLEYDKYQGVIEFVNEKGKKNAYDELVKLLDEKFRDIEDEMFKDSCNIDSTNYSSSYSSNDCTSDSKSQTDCSESDYENTLDYCNNDGPKALVLSGFLNITQPEKFNKFSGMGKDNLKFTYCDIVKSTYKSKHKTTYKCKYKSNYCETPCKSSALVMHGSLTVTQPAKFTTNYNNCPQNILKVTRKSKKSRHKDKSTCKNNYCS